MKPQTALPSILPESYPTLLEDIKNRIRETQIKAAMSVNQELIKLHWWIGSEIVKRQEIEDWGSQVIEKLCKDIQSGFPGLKGFSRSNVFYMRTFYTSYAKVQQAVGQLQVPPDYCVSIPWGHNMILINKVKNLEEREWYARRAVEQGCSRSVLEMWIETQLYHRQGKAPNNFQKSLPAPYSDLAEQIVKDPYCFDFLTLINEAREKEIEDGLMDHLQKFLLELGSGFAFVGRQVPLRVGDEDFYLDLLFYHIKLRCYIVIELKAVKFKPDFAGQVNFYLAAIDDKLRQPGDNPTIGLLLCKGKDNLVVEYALRNNTSPISVANFETQIAKALPDNLKGTLPSVEEIEAELERSLQEHYRATSNDDGLWKRTFREKFG
jgi:predicted nuclease of restriction endonuclease-like (RecB) superfamily